MVLFLIEWLYSYLNFDLHIPFSCYSLIHFLWNFLYRWQGRDVGWLWFQVFLFFQRLSLQPKVRKILVEGGFEKRPATILQGFSFTRSREVIDWFSSDVTQWVIVSKSTHRLVKKYSGKSVFKISNQQSALLKHAVVVSVLIARSQCSRLRGDCMKTSVCPMCTRQSRL